MSYPVTKWQWFKKECDFAIPLLVRAGVPWHYESKPFCGNNPHNYVYWRIERDDTDDISALSERL